MAKEEKKGFFTRVSRFFKDMVGELKKVTWPSKKQVFNNTGIVIAFMALTAVVISLFDLGFTKVLEIIFGSSF